MEKALTHIPLIPCQTYRFSNITTASNTWTDEGGKLCATANTGDIRQRATNVRHLKESVECSSGLELKDEGWLSYRRDEARNLKSISTSKEERNTKDVLTYGTFWESARDLSRLPNPVLVEASTASKEKTSKDRQNLMNVHFVVLEIFKTTREQNVICLC